MARRRAGAIVLDVTWKAIWIGFTGLLFLLGMLWLRIELGNIELNRPVSAFQSPLALLILARELWRAYASTFFAAAAVLAGVSAAAWIVLEATFRAGLLPASSDGFVRKASTNFKIFLVSSLLKIVLAGGTALVLALIVLGRYPSTPFSEWPVLWLDSRGAFFVASLVSLILWFAFTLLETLIRGNALELFGREMFLVVGLIATLLLFEGAIWASAAVTIVTLMALVSGTNGILLVFVAGSVFATLLSVLHSYLLLVRFSALESVARQFSEEFHPGADRLQSR